MEFDEGRLYAGQDDSSSEDGEPVEYHHEFEHENLRLLYKQKLQPNVTHQEVEDLPNRGPQGMAAAEPALQTPQARAFREGLGGALGNAQDHPQGVDYGRTEQRSQSLEADDITPWRSRDGREEFDSPAHRQRGPLEGEEVTEFEEGGSFNDWGQQDLLEAIAQEGRRHGVREAEALGEKGADEGEDSQRSVLPSSQGRKHTVTPGRVTGREAVPGPAPDFGGGRQGPPSHPSFSVFPKTPASAVRGRKGPGASTSGVQKEKLKFTIRTPQSALKPPTKDGALLGPLAMARRLQAMADEAGKGDYLGRERGERAPEPSDGSAPGALPQIDPNQWLAHGSSGRRPGHLAGAPSRPAGNPLMRQLSALMAVSRAGGPGGSQVSSARIPLQEQTPEPGGRPSRGSSPGGAARLGEVRAGRETTPPMSIQKQLLDRLALVSAQDVSERPTLQHMAAEVQQKGGDDIGEDAVAGHACNMPGGGEVCEGKKPPLPTPRSKIAALLRDRGIDAGEPEEARASAMWLDLLTIARKVVADQKAQRSQFLRALQTGTLQPNLEEVLDVRVETVSADACLRTCECQLLRLPAVCAKWESHEKLFVMFNLKANPEILVKVGSVVRIHPPWQEIMIQPQRWKVILCTYQSQIIYA